MGVKICPKCNGKVSDNRIICPHCQYDFSVKKIICPDCNEEIDAGLAECPICGHYFDVSDVGNEEIVCVASEQEHKSEPKKELTGTGHPSDISCTDVKTPENSIEDEAQTKFDLVDCDFSVYAAKIDMMKSLTPSVKRNKNPIGYFKHMVKDPITNMNEANARKKEILPWFIGSIATAILSFVIEGILGTGFLSFIGMVGLIGIAFFALLLHIIKKAKEKFIALICKGCDTMVQIKTPEDFINQISYTIGENKAAYMGVSHSASNNGIISDVTATAIAPVTIMIDLRCKNCGNTKILKYATTAFKCVAKQTNVPVRDLEMVKFKLENAVKAVVEEYNDPQKRYNIPFSHHSCRSVHFNDASNFKVVHTKPDGPIYNGVIIKKHMEPDDALKQYFLLNQLDGTLSTVQELSETKTDRLQYTNTENNTNVGIQKGVISNPTEKAEDSKESLNITATNTASTVNPNIRKEKILKISNMSASIANLGIYLATFVLLLCLNGSWNQGLDVAAYKVAPLMTVLFGLSVACVINSIYYLLQKRHTKLSNIIFTLAVLLISIYQAVICLVKDYIAPMILGWVSLGVSLINLFVIVLCQKNIYKKKVTPVKHVLNVLLVAVSISIVAILTLLTSTNKDGIRYVITDDGYAAVIGADSTVSNLEIPDSVKINGQSYEVKGIYEGAFKGCTSLTSITIPSSVTEIDGYAFYGCSSLTSITIPNGVTEIDGYVFYGCTSLTSITIPSSVTEIDGSAFYGCPIENATIPTTAIDRIPKDKLTTIFINGGSEIDGSAFYCCSSLTSVTISNGVTVIGYEAFDGCTSLTSITIPSSVAEIGSYAFYGCTSLTSIIIQSSVTEIDGSAFYGCPIENATIPTTAIDCIPKDKLTTIVINGGSKIESCAFQDCTSLISITIPSSVTEIDGSAFYGCSSLTSITIPDSVTSIGDYAFYGCSSLTSITIPSSVTEIGSCAFQDCTSLTSITIPSSVTEIGSYAFYDCSSLTSIIIQSSVTEIDGCAFFGCPIENATIPTTAIDSIPKDKLTTIVINGGSEIESYAFQDCTSLDNVYYTGSEIEFAEISIGYNNDKLINAIIHYNYVPEE